MVAISLSFFRSAFKVVNSTRTASAPNGVCRIRVSSLRSKSRKVYEITCCIMGFLNLKSIPGYNRGTMRCKAPVGPESPFLIFQIQPKGLTW